MTSADPAVPAHIPVGEPDAAQAAWFQRLTAAVAEELPAAVELRHQLHADPRLSGDEQDTADAVVAALGLGELYLLGTVLFRRGLGRYLAEGVAEDAWTAADAARIAAMVGAGNAERAYRLAG